MGCVDGHKAACPRTRQSACSNVRSKPVCNQAAGCRPEASFVDAAAKPKGQYEVLEGVNKQAELSVNATPKDLRPIAEPSAVSGQ